MQFQTLFKKIATEYHDFIVFSVAIFNILIKMRPLFILTEHHGSGLLYDKWTACA